MPAVIGVRVHFSDARSPILHSEGRSYRVNGDGSLKVMGAATPAAPCSWSAVHAPMEWAWAELVHGEPEPVAVTVDAEQASSSVEELRSALRDIASGRDGEPEQPSSGWPYFMSPAERIAAAQTAVQDAQTASAQSMREHAAAITAAQRALADLHTDLLGDAA